MADREIDAISIGISANIKDLKEDLAAANEIISSHRLPADKTYRILVNQASIGPSIEKAQKYLDNRVLWLKNVKFKPNIADIDQVRTQIETRMRTKPINVPLTVENTAKGLMSQIQAEIKPVELEINWHWGSNGPPPSGGVTGAGPGGPSRPSTPAGGIGQFADLSPRRQAPSAGGTGARTPAPTATPSAEQTADARKATEEKAKTQKAERTARQKELDHERGEALKEAKEAEARAAATRSEKVRLRNERKAQRRREQVAEIDRERKAIREEMRASARAAATPAATPSAASAAPTGGRVTAQTATRTQTVAPSPPAPPITFTPTTPTGRGTGGQPRPGRTPTPIARVAAPTPELTSMVQGAGGHYAPGVGIAARAGSRLATQGVTFQGQHYSLEDIQGLYAQRQVPASFQRATEAEQDAAIAQLMAREVQPLSPEQKHQILQKGLGEDFNRAMDVLGTQKGVLEGLPKKLKPEHLALRATAESELGGVAAGATKRLEALKQQSIDSARKKARRQAGQRVADAKAAGLPISVKLGQSETATFGPDWDDATEKAYTDLVVSKAFPKRFMKAVAAKPKGGEQMDAYTLQVLANRMLLGEVRGALNPESAHKPSATTMAHPSAGGRSRPKAAGPVERAFTQGPGQEREDLLRAEIDRIKASSDDPDVVATAIIGAAVRNMSGVGFGRITMALARLKSMGIDLPEERQTGGPVRGKRTRLYRGDTSVPGSGRPAPDWVLQSPEYKDAEAARGRWFTHSPDVAQEYVDRFGAGGPGKLTSVTVGPRQLEKYRVSNMSLEGMSYEERIRTAKRFSADPENEWFLPRKVANRAKPWEPRQDGGPVQGKRYLPVFGRGVKGITPALFGNVGDEFQSLYGFPYQLQRVPMEGIRPAHGVVEDRVGDYTKMATGSVAPPIILGPRGIVQDGHHRLETARRRGEKDILAYVFTGDEKDLPVELRRKLGIEGRQDGGGVEKGPGSIHTHMWGRIRHRYDPHAIADMREQGRWTPASHMLHPLGEAGHQIIQDAKQRPRPPLDFESFTSQFPVQYTDFFDLSPEQATFKLRKMVAYHQSGIYDEDPQQAESLSDAMAALLSIAWPKDRLRVGGGKTKADPSKIGAKPVTERFHHTYAWRQMSVAQRAKQPFCTYCGTSGSPENPLQGEHIRPIKLGGAKTDPHNITTACKRCNLQKGKSLDWMAPGRQEGGGVEGLHQIRSLRSIQKLLGDDPLYYRWSPNIEKDLQPGATSATLFNRARREAGISARRLQQTPGFGLNREYDLGGKKTWSAPWGGGHLRNTFAKRTAYLLRGEEIGRGWDGEPLLDPESIEPIAKLSRKMMERAGALDLEHERQLWAKDPKASLRRYEELEDLKDEGRRSSTYIPTKSEWSNLKAMTDIGRAEGGPVGKYLVGEKRPEAFIGRSGMVGIVGKNGPELFSPPEDGQILPYVPAAVEQAVPREDGGPTLRYRGPTGRYESPRAAGARAEGAGAAMFLGGVIRVAVINWPPALSSGGRTTGQAQGGLNFGTQTDFEKFASQFGIAVDQFSESVSGASGGATAAGASRGPRQAKLDPEEALRSRLEAINAEEARGLKARIQTIKAGVAETQQQLPVRSLAPAFGQITATIFGGRGEALARLARARDLTAEATKALTLYEGEQRKLNDAQTRAKDLDPIKAAAAADDVEKYSKSVALAKDNVIDWASQAEIAAKHADSFGLKLRVLTGNTAGIIGGTIVFGATLKAATLALGAASEAATPAVERFTGFFETTRRVTGALSDQERELRGNTKAVIATAAAHAGLSDTMTSTLMTVLQQRVEFEAGNKAFMEQLDLIHTSQNVQRGGLGFLTPQGGIPGLSRATGGFLGSPINAVPSLIEQVSTEAAGGVNPDLPKIGLSPRPPKEIEGIVDFILGGPFGAGLFKTPDQNQNTKNFQPVAQTLTENAKKVGSNFALLDVSQQANSQALIDASKKTLMNAGASEAQADALGVLKFAIVDVTNGLGHVGAAADNAAKQFLTAAEQGALVPTTKQLLDINERSRQAQIGNIQASFTRQTQTTIPAQRALDFLGNRPVPFGTGITPVTGTGNLAPTPTGLIQDQFSGPDPAAIASFGQYENAANSALSAIIAKADQGRAALERLGVDPAQIRQLEELGVQVLDIQTNQANAQAANAARQYNHELFVTKRNLYDVLALSGRRVGNEGQLGALQRQQIDNQRESQRLAFSLQQRQINFQTALAGFEVPGLTPEEQAAKVKQQKIESDIAQKQLNLGKQGFNIGIDIFNVSNQRQIQDLQFALSDLEQSHQIQLNGEAASQTIALIQKQIQNTNQDINASLAKNESIFAAEQAEAAGIVAITGEAFGAVSVQVRDAWKTFFDAITVGSQSVINSIGGGGGGGTGPGGSKVQAPGFFGQVNTPTNFTAGEAGPETVLILRNARSTMAGGGMGGGGGGGANISFSVAIDARGATVDDKALTVWKDAIVREVTKSIGRTLSLTGSRFG